MNRVFFEHDRIISIGAEDGPEHVAGRLRVNLEDKEQERDNILGEAYTNTTDPAFEKVPRWRRRQRRFLIPMKLPRPSRSGTCGTVHEAGGFQGLRHQVCSSGEGI